MSNGNRKVALRQRPGTGGKKNTHNWIELSERDCGDRNRPAEVDLSGSGETSPVEERGGGIRLSKHRARAAAEAQQQSRGREPIEEQMKEERDDSLVVRLAAPAGRWPY